MTFDEVVTELTERFQGRLLGLGYVQLGRGAAPKFPPETATALAQVAGEWLVERGVATPN